MASLTTSASGFLAVLVGAGPGFAFFAFGGVWVSSDSSSNVLSFTPEASSSESGFGRFFEDAVLAFAAGLSAVCAAFLGAALTVAVFLVAFGAAFALGF
jgi:hypothetical protein